MEDDLQRAGFDDCSNGEESEGSSQVLPILAEGTSYRQSDHFAEAGCRSFRIRSLGGWENAHRPIARMQGCGQLPWL